MDTSSSSAVRSPPLTDDLFKRGHEAIPSHNCATLSLLCTLSVSLLSAQWAEFSASVYYLQWFGRHDVEPPPPPSPPLPFLRINSAAYGLSIITRYSSQKWHS